MKFSVIITVYNTSVDYLCECINSVLYQEYDNIEIIIIDDGSTKQETLDTLEKYKNGTDLKGKELIIQHKPNGGQGSARNAGLALSCGEYVLFLDNDDYYMSTEFIGDIAKLLTESKADILSFQYEEFFNNNNRPQLKIGSLSRERILNQPREVAIKTLLSAPRSVFSTATHTKALRIGFLRDNNITALEGISNEDVTLTALMISCAETFDRYNKVVYAYRRTNTESISTQNENSLRIANNIIKQIELLMSDEKFITDKNVINFLSSPFAYWMAKMAAASTHIDDSQIEKYNEILKAGSNYSYLLSFSSRLQVRLIGLFVSIFGMKFAILIIKVFMLLNRKHMLSIKRKIS